MLERPGARIRPISVVPLVDVLLILLVFFMVTSTYLDLDTVPISQASEAAPAPGEAPSAGPVLLVRIGPDGTLGIAGEALSLDGLGSLLATRLAEDETPNLIVLPSPRADVQALVAVMDRATLSGVTRLRVVRLAEP
jgi:biopolymer transport protein ExbD